MKDPLPPRKPIQMERRRALDADDLGLMIRIAKEREALIAKLQKALENDQIEEALQLAWKICGREGRDAKPDRGNPALH